MKNRRKKKLAGKEDRRKEYGKEIELTKTEREKEKMKDVEKGLT